MAINLYEKHEPKSNSSWTNSPLFHVIFNAEPLAEKITLFLEDIADL